jgi:hypothetical protein
MANPHTYPRHQEHELKARTPEESLAIGMANAQEVGDCLEWQGTFSNKGTQPTVKYRSGTKTFSENLSVPKMLWERENGPVPEGKIVFRKCCNNACVLQAHIVVGTRKEWQKARKRAGATKHSPATIISLTIAARNRETTLNSTQRAQAVRELLAAGKKQEDVVAETGVSIHMVKDIGRNRSWRDLGSPFSGLGAR